MKVNKIKFTLILVLTFLMAISMIAFAVNSTKTSKAEEFTIDLFEANGASIEAAYNSSSGVKMYTQEEDGVVKLKNQVSGHLSFKYSLLDKNNFCDIRVIFADVDSGERVELLLDYSANDINVSVTNAGVSSGIYYGGRGFDTLGSGVRGRTKLANDCGAYTIKEISDVQTVEFDPASYSFYIDNTLIWCYSAENNDGKETDLLTGFEVYTVQFQFENVNKSTGSGILLNSINGVSLKNHTFANGETSLVVPSGNYARVGVSYKLARPYLYNLADGLLDVSNVNVKVFDSKGTVILNQKYSSTLTFMPEEGNDNYKVEYSYKNSNGKVSKSIVNIACYNDETAQVEYILNSSITGESFGVNTQLTLPSAYIESKLFPLGSDEEVLVDVYKGSEIYKTYQNLSAKESNSILLEDEGSYKISYYSACEYVTEKYEKDITVSASLFAHDEIKISDVLEVGVKVEIPQIKFYLNGQSVDATSKIIAPSGKTFANKFFNFTELGVYVVEFSADIADKTYFVNKEIEVVNSGKTLFDYDASVNEVIYGSAASTDRLKGINVVTTANNSELTYKRKIDLNKIDRNTPLIEVFGDPKSLEEAAFSSITVKLTDAYDSSNVITILCVEKTDGDIHGSYVRAGATGQTPGGICGVKESGAYKWNKTYGFPTLLDFRGKPYMGNIEDATLNISFDYAERRLYSGNSYSPWTVEPHDYMIADFDDPNLYLNPWKGFTTGECYLSISVAGIKGSAAEYTILSIAGETFDKEHVFVNEKPEISVGVPESGVPTGLINNAYEIFPATALDYYLDKISVDTKVYYLYGRNNQGEIDVVDGEFLPKLPGTYTIEYTAIDCYGNYSIKTIDVTVAESIEDIKFTFGDGVTSADIAKEVNIKSILSATSGSGNVDVKVELTSPSNDPVELFDNVFVPDEAGEYVVKYTFTDYIGRTVSDSYTITVVDSGELILVNELSLPKYFISGISYELEESYAIDRQANNEKVPAQIYVTDSNDRNLISGSVYNAVVVNNGELITVEYVYNSTSGKTKTVTKQVEGVVVKDGSKILMQKYFVCENVDASTNDGAVILKPTAKNATADFAKAIYSGTLRLEFAFALDAFNIDVVSILLTNADGEGRQIKFDFRYEDSILYCSLNGAPERSMGYMLIENGTAISFVISYNQTTKTWEDYNNRVFAEALTYADGTSFEGLSEYVYFGILFGQIDAGKTFELFVRQVNNQALNGLYSDRSAPEIVLSDIKTNMGIGDTLTIATIVSYDVLGNVVSNTVTLQLLKDGVAEFVRDKNGLVLDNVDASITYDVVIGDYGEYVLTYNAKDNSNRTSQVIKNISVLDDIKPEIVVSGEYNTEYDINDTITIKSMSVSDNVTLSSKLITKIYVVDSNGAMTSVKAGDSFKFILYGKHVVRYFAVDELGNINIVDFNINVEVA